MPKVLNARVLRLREIDSLRTLETVSYLCAISEILFVHLSVFVLLCVYKKNICIDIISISFSVVIYSLLLP